MDQPQQSTTPTQVVQGGDQTDEDVIDPLEVNTVQQWCSRIKKAKGVWKNDFRRMRDNMNFAAGLQWPSQKQMVDKRYIANITNRAVQGKVASLYAKNPTAEYKRRPRLDFPLYDGNLESIMPIIQGAMQGQPLPPPAMALIQDFAHGMAERTMIDKVGKTLEILFQYQLDSQDKEEGEFKLSMKQLVRRVITTGVGYCRPSFTRDVETLVTSAGASNTMANQMQEVKAIIEKLQEGDLEDDDPKIATLQNLIASMGVSSQNQSQNQDVTERMVFDFIPSTMVIPDTKCRQLKGFVGARWIAQEFIMAVEDINAIFDVDVQISTGAKQYKDGSEVKQSTPNNNDKDSNICECCMWEVIDKQTKSHFYIVDGYKQYVVKPQPLEPDLDGFWPIVALTFNDVEVEEGLDATIFPPSDVQLMSSAQKEWNRIRNELMKHRKANAPGYIALKGMLTSGDKDNLENAPSNSVVELEGLPQGSDINKVIVPRIAVPIQPLLYDVGPEQQDIQLTIGSSQENLGMVNPRGTATGQTIAEQSRLTVTTSNIDDLDDFLSTLARMSGQIMLKEMQVATVQKIVGPGAVWPQQPATREMFCDQIFLSTKAASSGRPNKDMDLKNWQLMAPILQQYGANPQFMVRETIKRLDDRMDPEEAFPLIPPGMLEQGGLGQQPQGGQHQPGGQEQHVPGQNMPPQQARPGPGQLGQQQQPMMTSTN